MIKRIIDIQNMNHLPDERSVIIHVGGRVQGVGFRFFTHQKAQKLNLVGYVKNLVNGDVEILACGTHIQIQALIDWLAAGGPPSAKISYYDVNKIALYEPYHSFNVRY